MKRLLTFLLAVVGVLAVSASDPLADQWTSICGGSKGTDWYGSAEAVSIADTLLAVQKTSGGWGKNIGYHCLTADDLAALKAAREERSCMDNTATYNEMRYLARVWQQTGVERFRASFEKALKMLLKAEKLRGGWSQYYPLYGNGSYVDYITYNDNLMVNIMRLMHDVAVNAPQYAGMIDEDTRTRCREAFGRALDLTLRLQIDDNGVKAGWCAQYDPADNAACWARKFEPPSVSGCESMSLLSFLMSLSQPSPELQDAIISAVEWFDGHKIEDKALESYVNDRGEKDCRIIDRPGANLWGRFIQLGGESGKKMYDKFFKWIRSRAKSHDYIYDGVKYTYTEYEGVKSSYREDMAYQPIYSSHRDDEPHMAYRFLYNYEDTAPVTDSKGCPITTSLTASERTAYCYIGDWGQKVLYTEYPVWKQAVDLANLGEGLTAYELSGETCLSADEKVYSFDGGFSISNNRSKTFQTGLLGTVKYSQQTNYTIAIPEGMEISKITFFGYDNYDVDAFISELNGKSLSAGDYPFPAKVDGEPQYMTHVIDFADGPVTDKVTFTLSSKQCCLRIYLYGAPASGVRNPEDDKVPEARTSVYNLGGVRVANPAAGIYVRDGKKVVLR